MHSLSNLIMKEGEAPAFASLCILSYKRPEMLVECLKSLHETIDYPCELIVNFDGVDGTWVPPDVIQLLSKVIMSYGKNRGVGKSFQNCLGISEGNYIFKIDADLIFKPHWLSTAIGILDKNPDVGCLSLFNYRNYDPADERFNVLEEREDCLLVDDFVSSVFGFRRSQKKRLFKNSYDTLPDDGLHQKLKKSEYSLNHEPVFPKHLAITKEDMVVNQGFGEKSVYVSFDKDKRPYKTKVHSEPLLFGIS